MAEAGKPLTQTPAPARQPAKADADKVLCERCGAEMFRMHAVWRCPVCRFKTDCCGW
jgi:rubrerythrin